MSEFQIGDARKPDLNAMRIDCASVYVLSQCFGFILTISSDIQHYEDFMVLQQTKVDGYWRNPLAHKPYVVATIRKIIPQKTGIAVPKKRVEFDDIY